MSQCYRKNDGVFRDEMSCRYVGKGAQVCHLGVMFSMGSLIGFEL